MTHVLFTHSYFYRMDPKQWKNQTPFPPLGTVYAASNLRENNFDVSLFDVGLKENPSELETILKTSKPAYLVIYDDGFNYLTKMCLTKMREACFEMISYGKKNNCKVIISSSDSTKAALPRLIPLALTIPSLIVTKSITTPFEEVFSDIVSTFNSAPIIISLLLVHPLMIQMGFLQMPCRCMLHQNH